MTLVTRLHEWLQFLGFSHNNATEKNEDKDDNVSFSLH